ncbi:uncharacterized protein LOC131857032 [Cryptomeria japonica]|uniref:uncharacterized protein LOC131857032 n=1 Tax=Cryptomeria japonica TaxID=3369 RepID=UPI0027DA74C0|nr:uncharacterized protein LOC131857032 [Cryptomeria japonica]
MEVNEDLEDEQGKEEEIEVESKKEENAGGEEERKKEANSENPNSNPMGLDRRNSKWRDLDNKINNLIKETNSGKKSTEEETSEAEEEIEMQEWAEKDIIKKDLKHLEDVIIIVKEKIEEDNENITNWVAKTEKALKSFMNHSLEVLRVSSQNMNSLVDHLEMRTQNKDLVIIDDLSTSTSTTRRRTRQTTSDIEKKTKEI